jgi:hypothetical protein
MKRKLEIEGKGTFTTNRSRNYWTTFIFGEESFNI